MRIKLSLCVILLFCSLSQLAYSNELISNGGFESMLDHWGSTTNVSSQTSFISGIAPVAIDPHSGSRIAVMAPFGVSDASLWQEVDFTGYTYATLSFWWRYDAVDMNEPDFGVDKLRVLVGDGQSFPDTIWEAPININPADGHVVSPWMFGTVSGDVSDLEKATFTFRLLNASPNGEGDFSINGFGQLTAVYLDDVSINAVPEPASILLLGTGLSLIGIAISRRKR